MRPQTLADRFSLLIPWLNAEHDERRPLKEREYRLRRFVTSFDGSAAAGFVRAEVLPDAEVRRRYPDLLFDLETLHFVLNDLLARGFPKDYGSWPVRTDVPTLLLLEFGTERQARVPRGQRHGHYRLVVRGALGDLAQYLLMHLLTLPGAGALTRCPAPAPYDPTAQCGKWLLRAGPGYPRRFCSATCRVRAHLHAAEERETQQRTRRGRT
jgi:hypothetical protein